MLDCWNYGSEILSWYS